MGEACRLAPDRAVYSDPMNVDAATPGPTNPYHIARAYASGPLKPVAPVPPVSRVVGNTPAATLSARSVQAGSVTPSMNTNVRRLVAGTVPGKVDFSGDVPRQTGPAIAMYRHPAEKNAAATSVNAGRLIDLNG